MAAIDRVSHWALEFCNSRGNIVEGSPLWAYKVTDEELKQLQRAFTTLFTSLTPHTVFSHYINRIDKPLVIYMATWLQRNTKGRVKWEMVTESIGLKYDNSTRSNIVQCVKSGLKKWGLSVHFTSSNRYLDTLYCHGGFPRSDMLGICNSHLMNYFENVLRHYASYQHSSELQLLANNELRTLPESLQQDPFSRLTTSLIEFLVELRDEFHLYDYNEPLAMLEVKQPEWKSALPFLMIDEEAEVLVNKLLNKTSKVVRRSQNPVRLKRYLKLTGDFFSLYAEVYINHTIHPEDLSSVFDGVTLPNYFELSSYTAKGERFRTASFSYRAGTAPRWMVSTIENTMTQQNALGELSYQLFADGEGIGSGTYYRGETLESHLPWIFEDKTGQPNFVGQGSFRTKEESLYIVCDAQPTKVSHYSTFEKLGVLSGVDRDIYKVSGHLKIESVLGDFHVRTKESEKLNTKINILGKTFNKGLSKLPIYIGKPNLILDDDAQFSREEFFWVNKSKVKSGYFCNDSFIGEGSIVWVSNGEVNWVHQCIILPPNFNVELIHIEQGSFEAKFYGVQNAVIGMGEGQETWLVEEPEEISGMLFADINVPDLMCDFITFRIFWDNDVNTETIFNVPIQIDSVALVDRQNLPYRTLEMGRLTIEDLNQLNLMIKADSETTKVRVKADLMNIDKLIATISHEFIVEAYEGKHKISGSSVANLASRLFRHGTVPDNTVNLTIFANGNILESQIPTVHRYKQVINVSEDKSKVLLEKIPQLFEKQQGLELKMSPIWDFKREPITLNVASSKNLNISFDLPHLSEYGTWLLWSESTANLRPRIIEFEVPMRRKQDAELGGLGQLLKAAMNHDSIEEDFLEDLKIDSLEHAVKYLKFNKNRSTFDFRDIDKIILEMSLDINHQGWLYVDTILCQVDEIEPDTFHVVKRLMSCSNALTLLLIKNNQLFNKVWNLTESLPFEWYTVPFSAWQSAISIVKEKISEDYKVLKETAPLVYQDILKQQFSSLAGKGEYFSTIVSIALGNYETKKEIWSTLDGDKSLIGRTFLKARADLYSSHDNKLMKISQIKRKDDDLIKQVEITWPKSDLPRDLHGFFKKAPINDTRSHIVIRAQKLTIELPVLLAFYNMGMFKGRLPGWAWNYLSFLLTQVQQFDRQWLQKSMSLATEAVYTTLTNADWHLATSETEITGNEIDHD